MEKFLVRKRSSSADRRAQKRAQRKTSKPLILMARQEGFEPPTIGFVVRYSIQLSYWRNLNEEALYPEKWFSTSGFCQFKRMRRSFRSLR